VASCFQDVSSGIPEELSDLSPRFCTAKLDAVASHNRPDQQNQVLGICVVKNDLARLQMAITHHRSLGVQQFAVLDNGSTDGTQEWLSSQSDIDVYVVTTPFSSQRKYGWINQLLARYGYDRWYLYFDSDELFVYPDLENITIQQLIEQVERRQLDRLGALMLDMYSDKPIYAPAAEQQPIEQEFCYFDSDSYEISQSKRGKVVKGGPRKRVFSPELDDSPLLIKFPLFYLREGMIFESAHYLFPFRNQCANCQRPQALQVPALGSGTPSCDCPGRQFPGRQPGIQALLISLPSQHCHILYL